MTLPKNSETPHKSRRAAWMRPRTPSGGIFRNVVVGSSVLTLVVLIVYPLGMLLFGLLLGDGNETESSPWVLVGDLTLLGNTLFVAVGSTLVSLVFGLPLAWITARSDIKYPNILGRLILIPFYMTPLLGAIGWSTLAGPHGSGVMNFFIASFSGQPGPLNVGGMWGIVWVVGLYHAPLVYMFAHSALLQMEPALEESSCILGSGNLQTALRVTFPLIRPAIVGSSLLCFVLGLGQFGVPAILGSPNGFYVYATKIFQYVNGYQPDYRAAAMVGVLLFALAAGGVYLQSRALRGKNYTTITGKGFRPRRVSVGRWRLSLQGFVGAYLLLALILPVGAVVWASAVPYIPADPWTSTWTFDNFVNVLVSNPLARLSIQNSVFLATVGASIGLVLCTVVAWIQVRTKWRARGALEYLAMVPLAVPGMVFGVGLLWAWIAVPWLPIYGTIWILLLALVTIFLPYGIRSVSATLYQIDSSLEEAASLCGSSWGHAMRTITLPLVRPGMMAAWVLLFISMIKELSTVALLYNSKTITMSISVFDFFDNSSVGSAAAMVVVQTAIVMLCLGLVQGLGSRRGLTLA